MPKEPAIICLSHLRWNFVWQRPQHLMTRFARERDVFFVEEPQCGADTPRLQIQESNGVHVVIPLVQEGMDLEDTEDAMVELISELVDRYELTDYVLWYYTPMALPFTTGLQPVATVYDCMDELSLFRGAPVRLIQLEQELLRRGDLVFTGGQSLYRAKQDRHPRVYCFPSSVDRSHFGRARDAVPDPSDQAEIPHPRIGFAGVIDERMDLELLDEVAYRRPEWNLVMVGPVTKIEEEDLPRHRNIHYLGQRAYEVLPRYLAHWDVAILPFALNEATRFISPTKTPEYLAAGKPVVSTPITDVAHPYGDEGLVHIAENVDEFIASVEEALRTDMAAHHIASDSYLDGNSWDETWQAMRELIDQVSARERALVGAGRER